MKFFLNLQIKVQDKFSFVTVSNKNSFRQYEHSENKIYILQIFQEQLGVNLKKHNGEFHEKLLGKIIFVKSGPKLFRNLLEDLSMLESTWRHYIDIYMSCLPEKVNQFLQQPKRDKHYANAPQCQVLRTFLSYIKVTSGGSCNIRILYLSTQTFS